MNIALLGPSGVGKGTHAAHLASRYRLMYLCTGDLFRRNLLNRTALGLRAKDYMDRGELVPDEVVESMLDNRLHALPGDTGILFDGFPRTKVQADYLAARLKQLHRELDAVIYLHLSDLEIIRRLSGRTLCSLCGNSFHRTVRPFSTCPSAQCHGEHLFQRPDDSRKMAEARLKLFHRTSGPLLDHYDQIGKLVCLSGSGSIDHVQNELTNAIESISSGEIRASSRITLGEIRRSLKAKPRQKVQLRSATLDLVLLGAPGSGKGTQAEDLAKELNVSHIATGDLFRENLKNETPLGQLAKTYMNRGELVPDEITDAMVEDRLARPDADRGFILDGFPRNLHQADALDEMLSDLGRRFTAILYIKVPDQEIIHRLSGRRVCRDCQSPYHVQFKPPRKPGCCDRCGGALYQRADDSAETIRARLMVFHAQTEPLIEFYRQAKLLIEIDGAQPISSVTRDSLRALQRAIANDAEPRACPLGT